MSTVKHVTEIRTHNSRVHVRYLLKHRGSKGIGLPRDKPCRWLHTPYELLPAALALLAVKLHRYEIMAERWGEPKVQAPMEETSPTHK